MVIPDNSPPPPPSRAVTLICLYLIACHSSRWITYSCFIVILVSWTSSCVWTTTTTTVAFLYIVQMYLLDVFVPFRLSLFLPALSVRQWLSVAVKRHWERHRDDCRVASHRAEVISHTADPALSFVSRHLRRWQLLCQQRSITQFMNLRSSQSLGLWIQTAVSCWA